MNLFDLNRSVVVHRRTYASGTGNCYKEYKGIFDPFKKFSFVKKYCRTYDRERDKPPVKETHNNLSVNIFKTTNLLCITDLIDIFKEFYTLLQSIHYLYALPGDIWEIIGSYLERDYNYLQIIMAIYNCSTNLDYDKKITIIDFNELVHGNDLVHGDEYMYLRYQNCN